MFMKKKILLLIFISVFCANANAQFHLVPDSSFSNDGIVSVDLTGQTDKAYSLAIQPDGKIVVTGYADSGPNFDIYIERFNTDGTLDTSFSNDGIQTTAIGIDKDKSYALVLQPDGKIVIVGSTKVGGDFNMAFVRYLTNGDLDSSFGTDGITSVSLSNGNDPAYSVFLQPDGKIVAAGYAQYDLGVVRLTSNGIPDSTFDFDGIAKEHIGSTFTKAHACVLQPDGKIVVAGSVNSGNDDIMILRLNSNGSLDSTFHSNGIYVLADTASYAIANALVLQPNGKIILSGFTISTDSLLEDFITIRFNTDGTIDSTFGENGNGIVLTDFDSAYEEAYSVLIDSSARIIVAGSSLKNNERDFAIAFYTTDGIVDTSLTPSGKITMDVYNGNDYGHDIAVTPSGKLIECGFSARPAGTDISLVQFRVDTIPHDTVIINSTENISENDFNVFPSPFSDWFVVRSSKFVENTAYELRDVFGRELIFLTNNHEPLTTIDASELADGMYFLTVANSFQRKTFKLVKE